MVYLDYIHIVKYIGMDYMGLHHVYYSVIVYVLDIQVFMCVDLQGLQGLLIF